MQKKELEKYVIVVYNDYEKASLQTERNWNEIRGESYRFL